MSAAGLEDLLGQLEAVLGRLADGSLPLDRLVADHEEATRLLAQAEERFRAISAQALAGALGEERPPA